ncbi:MAG: SUMF1/EgtB/PvdO family nonheme iron enzyme [Isosphaeraceae bacterium]
MSRLVVIPLLCAAILGPALAPVPAQEPAVSAPTRRVALLVGINEYRKRGFIDLKWAENDVAEMDQELRRLGFDKVVVMKGSSEGELRPSKENIEAQLKGLLADVGKDDIVLVMLSGHGQELKVKVRAPDGREVERDDGFYCPVSAVLNQPDTMVSLSYLTDDLLAKWGGKNLVLLDACRDGVVDLDKGVRARGVQGRVVSLPEGTAILFSCASRQTSLERDELRHGVFAYSVLETLRAEAASGAITWSALVDRVQNRVAELNPLQEPIQAGVMPRLVLGRRRGSPSLITNSLGMNFTLIKAGEFLMGSPDTDKDAEDDEKPQHRVRITRPFYLGVHEVTRGQFRRFVDDSGYQTDAEKDGKGGFGWNEAANKFEQAPRYTWREAGFEQTDLHPVVNVSWNDAVAFAEWLGRKEGKTYRLPTEAQWEYACRAGTTTRYFCGDDAEALAEVGNIADATAREKYPDWNYAIASRDGFVYTSPIGRYRPNAWGLHDMHGNVWEWCWDWYGKDFYKASRVDDPAGPLEAADRVIRGGSWNSIPRRCRSAFRNWGTPGYRISFLGFRLALAP